MATPIAVRHVKNAIRRYFADSINFSDAPGNSLLDEEPSSTALTRGLAALAVAKLSGCELDEAGASVIDGTDDGGIDAVHVDSSRSRLWLVQSKWRAKGNATLNSEAVLKFWEGVGQILSTEVVDFNERFQKKWPDVLDAIENPSVKITVVMALLGDDPVHENIKRKNDQHVHKHGVDTIDVEYLHLSDFHQIVKTGIDRARVDLDVMVDRCSEYEGPYPAYFGMVPVGQIKDWYEDHGDRLFDRNIRRSLGVTGVNQELIETLKSEPEHFWYFNNGITVLADSVHRGVKYKGVPGGSGQLTVEGASIVNGAQTVTAIHRAVREDPKVGERAQVAVRFISLGEQDDDFGERVTTATNTQNQVERRDFVALDKVQAELRDDLALTLGKTYALKRGEQIIPSQDVGCTVREATLALLCAEARPEWVARAKENEDVLWGPAADPLYKRLFGPEPTSARVWNSVRLFRVAQERLKFLADQREGRGSAIAEQGRLFITHMVFQNTDTSEIGDLDSDWDTELENAAESVELLLDLTIHYVDTLFGNTSYPLTTFKNPERCERLSEHVLTHLETGQAVSPEVRAAYTKPKKQRKPRMVSTLVDAGAIAEGTTLVFEPQSGPQRKGMRAWLEEVPERRYATWVNDRSHPLLWAWDGQRYAPSTLSLRMIQEAMGSKAPKAVQGPKLWFVQGEGSLVELAEQVLRGEAE
ncbi:AIPR family protein [Nocardiopsis listeri]|uniref:AIPR family protein n=1 Tax=Nocardiopsis listeri TaxID=53440 RepID=UPI00082E5C92|nr:AIPR family protein [Nocardiopsis listeri]